MIRPTRLSRFTLNHFKNIVLDEGFSPGALAILIGPNACGKSNLIGVLRFLKQSLVGSREEERGGTVWGNALHDILGGPGILDATLTAPQRVAMAFDFEHAEWPDGIRFEWILGVDKNPIRVWVNLEYVSVVRPVSNAKHRFFYEFLEDSPGIGTLRRPVPLKMIHPFRYTELVLRDPELSESGVPDVGQIAERLRRFIGGWRFYNASHMNLKAIRSAEPKIGLPASILSDSGENLPTVLDNLCQQDMDFEDRLNEACRELLPNTRRVRVARVGRLNVAVEWYMQGIKEPFYLDALSDGTVRMLCWAVILKTPNPATLLVLDEPELGLHVAWMPILAKWIKEAADRGTQVMIATHSSDLLDQFGDRIDHVYAFQQDADGRFTPRPLSPERLAARLAEGWHLGDLYRVGDPDIGGWPW